LAGDPARPGFRVCLVLGGARSGKTARALALAEALHAHEGRIPVYIATAQAYDDEMQARIDRHKAERGPAWRTVEAPLDLRGALEEQSGSGTVVLVDCLTLWLSNITFAERDPESEAAALAESLRAARGPVVVVSNEVGLSIVPENALARRFRDDQGRLNQTVAAAADRVEFVAAGLPLVLKADPAPPL
jgi:adenosylcobinamide kinase/adenosylcobinamide-phosphate guanylyltransferase